MIFQEKSDSNCLGVIAVYNIHDIPVCSARLWQSSEVFWVCRVHQAQSLCMACSWPNTAVLLSPLGFLDIICLLSDFWPYHLGCKATPEKKIWCLSSWLRRRTCSCSWTINCIMKTLACWLYPGWLLCVCEPGRSLWGWAVLPGRLHQLLIATWLTARHHGFPCL